MPINLPEPFLRLSPEAAGAITLRVRQLRRKGLMNVFEYGLVDAMLWGGARKHGQRVLTISAKVLARLAGQARSTVFKGLRVLEKFGIIRRIARRVRVIWVGGATASRVAANGYEFLTPDTASAPRTALSRVQIFTLEQSSSGQRKSQLSLEETLATRAAVFNQRWQAERARKMLGKN